MSTTKTGFYRPTPRPEYRFSRISCPERALSEILALVDVGTPKTLTEASRRLSVVRLIAQEGLGPETVFEMVCRILTADRSEPVTR